jgi:hypothetical protein
MKLFEILKQQGLFSNDIRTRIKNNQISINGEIINADLDLDIELKDDVAITLESGSFIACAISLNPIFAHQMKIFGLENLFDSNIKNDLTDILSHFIFVKISKRDSFILKRK